MQKFIHSSRNGAFTYCYLASEVDDVLKRQAAAAIAGMNAATAISRGQVQQAHRLQAESSPEMLESERQANAILTARIAELEKGLRDLSAEWVNGRNVLDGCTKHVADRVRSLMGG